MDSFLRRTLRVNKFLARLAGIKWQILLLKLGLVIAVFGSVFFMGVRHAEKTCYEDKITAANETVVKVQKFVPVISRQEKTASEQSARVGKKSEVYYEEVDKNDRPAACDLSDNELRAFQELTEG